MNFSLSAEQELLQSTVRDFAAKECPPQAVHAVFDGEREAVAALWRGLAEIGVAGLVVPEAHGGAGLELLELALVAEELGRGAVPVPFLGHALATLELDGAPAELLGADTAQRVVDAGCVLLAADAFGAAHRLVRATAAYLQTRQQFGQALAQFQALKHQLANMALEVDPTRGLWWYAAHAFDHVPAEASRAAALAKAHITDRAQQAARDAVEAHGGIGFTWECDVHLWFKRVMFDRLWLGGPELHRERYAALEGW